VHQVGNQYIVILLMLFVVRSAQNVNTMRAKCIILYVTAGGTHT